MIVLPMRFTTCAPRGTRISFTRATAWMCPCWTRTRASLIGSPPDPSIRVAPSRAITPSLEALQPASVTSSKRPGCVMRDARCVTWDPTTCGRAESATDFHALEEERERSARGHRVTAPQREARGAKREVKREGAHAHLVECERVAELARREVGGLVPVVQLLPAILHVAARDVARQRVLGVVAHEARQIAAVPIRSAPLQHRRDLGLGIS